MSPQSLTECILDVADALKTDDMGDVAVRVSTETGAELAVLAATLLEADIETASLVALCKSQEQLGYERGYIEGLLRAYELANAHEIVAGRLRAEERRTA